MDSTHAAVAAVVTGQICRTDKLVELEIPPENGNGSANAGIPLAKLLFFLKEHALVTLIEALLLERCA